MQLNRCVVVVVFCDRLRCQALDVETMRRLQQRRQLRMVDAHFAAIDKLEQRLQVAGGDAGQHDDRVLAWRVLCDRKPG